MVDKLRPKHKTLADEWLVDQNGQKAAERTGYSAKYARITANRILQRPEVKAYISERLEALKMGADEALRLLAERARDDSSKNVQLRALESIIKVHGLSDKPIEGELTFRVIYGDKDTSEEATPETARDQGTSG